MNRKEDMEQIRKLIAFWVTQIAFENGETYYDVNKVSEHLCRQLLNLLYGYELIDLNKVKSNFPGLDLGDPDKSKIAYQVTSRTDRDKIKRTLMTVVAKKYNTTFTAGIKFLILNQGGKVEYGPKAEDPKTILPSFDTTRDIVYPADLIKRIEEIYEAEADLITFTKISSLLTKELSLRLSRPENEKKDEENQQLNKLLKIINETLANSHDKDHTISRKFFDGDLDIPQMKVLSERPELTNYFRSIIKDRSFLWIQGPITTGKSSAAVNVARSWKNKVLWIDCREIQDDQLIEHLLGSICGAFKIELEDNFKSTLAKVAQHLERDTLVVINDTPQMSSSKKVKDQLGYLISVLIGAECAVTVTSNFNPPIGFGENEGFDSVPEVIPPFVEQDTMRLMEIMGAPTEILPVMGSIITTSTQGHPLIIKSAIKYLKERDWKANEETIVSIFKGSFDIGRERASYQALINETSTTEGRLLLYRLQFVIGNFDLHTVRKVAAIAPSIPKAEDQLNELLGIWVQQNQDGKYQISPLVKKLEENVDAELKKLIYLELAAAILERKNLSVFQASSAILYLHLAGENNRAAIILITALGALKNPEMFTGFGLNIFWYTKEMPSDIDTILQAQIRALQIGLTKDPEQVKFLSDDLQRIADAEGAGAFTKLLSSHQQVIQELQTHPLSSVDHLLELKTASEAVDKEFGLEEPITSAEIYKAIWLAFIGLTSIEEYRQWFQKIDVGGFPQEIFDVDQIEEYQIAAVSIYRNAVLHETQFDDQIIVLKEILDISIEKRIWLFAAYSLKYLVKVYTEHGKLDEAMAIVEIQEPLLAKSDIYRLLVYAELGSKAYLEGKQELSIRYIAPVLENKLPAFFPEMLDFQMAVAQLYAQLDPNLSAAFSEASLKLTNSNSIYLIEDKIKQHGEAAIGKAHIGKYQEALQYIAQGYELLLGHFQDNDEFKAIVIRFGHVAMYITAMLEYGYAKDFKEKDFVIPYAGFFYRTKDKLLEGGFYFEERKSLVATIIGDGFEYVLDKDLAKKWAFIALNLALNTEGGRFVPILEKVVFYLIEDSEFEKAYNVLAFVDRFYNEIEGRINSGKASAADRGIIERAKKTKAIHNDFGAYLHILFPAALKFSKNIRNGKLKPEEFQNAIDSAFQQGKYQPRNPDEFLMAKDLFEKIMIQGIDYFEMKAIIDKLTGDNRDFLYAICCYLLSGFTGAAQAANLQLATILILEKSFQHLRAFYNFSFVPYFEDFWFTVIKNNPNEFSGLNHLIEKGLPLISKTSLDKRIAKIFQVLQNHLDLQLNQETEAFISGGN